VPTFFARWLDGGFSIVAAVDESDAYVQLDEIADEPSEVWEMPLCLLDFELTDNGTFRLIEIGEETATEILKRSYPRLRKALAKEPIPQRALVDRPQIETLKKIRNAAKSEQNRLGSKSSKRIPAKSAIGRAIQSKMSCSGPYADALASAALTDKIASDHLKRPRPRKTIKRK
jgi:hypothetical protein